MLLDELYGLRLAQPGDFLSAHMKRAHEDRHHPGRMLDDLFLIDRDGTVECRLLRMGLQVHSCSKWPP